MTTTLARPDKRETVRLSTGRIIPEPTCSYSTRMFDALQGLTFDAPEDLARWVGTFYGWRSTTPTHAWADWDGVAWWVIDAMNSFYEKWPMAYWDLVPSLTEMSNGYHARLILVALEAAGLVLAPVEKVVGP